MRKSAEGFAIYDVGGEDERRIPPNEMMADVMSKREKNGGELGGKFVFKRHLFLSETIDLADEVEKHLLLHQVGTVTSITSTVMNRMLNII